MNPTINDYYLPRQRSGHSAGLYQDDFMVVFGGMHGVTKELDDVCALDLKTSSWFQITKPLQTKMSVLTTNPLIAKLGKQINKNIAE